MNASQLVHASFASLALAALSFGCSASRAEEAASSTTTHVTAGLPSCGAAADWMEESSAVPSSSLLTDFSVVRTSGEADVAILATLWKAAASPDVGPTQLRISATETITFSVGSSSVVCRQDQDCRLPFVPEGTYSVAFRRPSGEMIRSLTALPRETRITSPEDGALFDKNDAVDIRWTPSSSFGPHGIALSTFGCDTQGFIDWHSDTAARVPAGYVAQCPGAFHERLTVFYNNPARVPGVAGGAFKAYSQSTVHFTYLDDLVVADRVEARPLSRCELHDIVAAADARAAGTSVLTR